MNIGIDLGGSHIAVAIINEENNIVIKKEKNIEKDTQNIKQFIIETIKNFIDEILLDLNIEIDTIEKIGLSTPGKVKNNIIYDIYNLKIKEFNLCEILSNYYNKKVETKNDAKCAALAEKKLGNLKEYDNCVFLCLGTGIGGTTFIDGKLLNIPSEYGHMIIKKDGIECKCGNKGCFEKYASMNSFKDGFIKLLNLDKDISSENILNILKQNLENKNIISYIDNYLNDLMLGISNIYNIIEPDAICIGGSFVYFEDILYKRLIQNINLNKYNFNVPKILLAKFENDAGLIGSIL